jgi:DNA-binding CsgD family transcriptional regulator/PAS domain-containing protein
MAVSTQSDPIVRIVAKAYDAAVSPHLWASALDALTSRIGAVGAAYIIFNKQSGHVDWACFSGPSVEVKQDYVRHYAALDPYSPVLTAAPRGKWLALSDCLPSSTLRTDEWYNDFVRKSGVCDILGARLFDDSLHTVIFGLHQDNGQASLTAARVAVLEELLEPLSKAAGLHIELRGRGLKSGVAQVAFDMLAAGCIVTDADGHIVEMNSAAEQIVQRNDGLTVRNGKLALPQAFENAKLETLLATAAASMKSKAAIGHILVARRDHRLGYALTIAPLSPDLTPYERPLAIVVVTDPARLIPANRARRKDHREFIQTGEAQSKAQLLTPRELEILTWAARGKTAQETAQILNIATRTANEHVQAAVRKLGAANKVGAVAIAVSGRLIDQR